MSIGFKILTKSKKSQARLGVIQTVHGEIQTPAFVVVGTNAVVKGSVDPVDLANIGVQTVLGNTYHLLVRDQVKAVEKAGGLGKFMGFKGPTYTDSGGFQVFSLGQRLRDGVGKFSNYDRPQSEHTQSSRKPLVKISEAGAEFSSHLDGKRMKMTPESSIKIQNQIGADMIFAFDEPTSPTASHSYTKNSMERTHRWAVRCLEQHKKLNNPSISPLGKGRIKPALFGIVQGGPYQDLREESAKFMARLDFPGFGIGGSYHRRQGKKSFDELEWVIPHLPENKPRHFLGIGGIDDMIAAVRQGIDTFDCVIPTREARHGRLYKFKALSSKLKTSSKFKLLNSKRKFYEVVNVTNKKFRYYNKPLDQNCACPSCQRHTLSYLHHLFKAQERLGERLATLHNLKFYLDLMALIRQAISSGEL